MAAGQGGAPGWKLERSADLGNLNAGMLVFVDGGQNPEYVPWKDVARIVFDHAPA